MTCISTTIISRANSRVLPLLIIVTFPASMRLKLAVPFKETSMHSCEAVFYMIVYK